MYKIAELVQRNYDFAAVYPEQQKDVRQNTGLDFNLENITKFLQKQTNNFTIDNTIARDLDEGIYKVVTKYEQEQGRQKPEPTPEPTPNDEDEQNITALKTILMFDIDADGKEAIESIVEYGLSRELASRSLSESLDTLKEELKSTTDKEEIKQKQENIDYILSLQERFFPN
jgi:hypothetical protein